MAKPAQDVKQQIIDKINDVDAVLVAVNSNPSVDELSAALGATLALNKLGKHATAVFSGEVPLAIEFLEPGKTFENTVDSLRDFIIALDKEKADHLRYKVDGDMVKIFITPYRTTIDDRDLEFSQGDYNVEMVLAIGVQGEDDLDRALADHGRILHDATVVGISIGADSSNIGAITWHDDRAGSYSELLASLVTKLRGDKNLLDEQIATALLTGIVAATDRFSNEHTSSEAMTLAAQLMAAGANQQLIATQLEQAEELSQPAGISMSGVSDTPNRKDTRGKKPKLLDDNVRAKLKRDGDPTEVVKDKPAADGTMTISHTKKGDIDDVAAQVERENQEAATERAEEILAQGLPSSVAAPGLSMVDLQDDLKKATNESDAGLPSDPVELPLVQPSDSSVPPGDEPSSGGDGFIETPLVPLAATAPSFGGTLNATSEQAAADKRREEESDRNKTLLSHDGGAYAAGAPAGYPAVNSFSDAQAEEAVSSTVMEPAVMSTRGVDIQPSTQVAPVVAPEAPTLDEIDNQARGYAPSLSANDAMAAALGAASPVAQQQQHVPDLTVLPPLPSISQVSDPSIGGLPPLPPLPDFSALPPLPPTAGPQLPTVSPQNQGAIPSQAPAGPPDPSAFQIPGQG